MGKLILPGDNTTWNGFSLLGESSGDNIRRNRDRGLQRTPVSSLKRHDGREYRQYWKRRWSE
jgi:hypothetical protein